MELTKIITKEKNIYSFKNKNGKYYKLDVNTGIMYGVTGRKLTNFPDICATFDCNYDDADYDKLVLFNDLFYTRDDQQTLQFVDRLISLNKNCLAWFPTVSFFNLKRTFEKLSKKNQLTFLNECVVPNIRAVDVNDAIERLIASQEFPNVDFNSLSEIQFTNFLIAKKHYTFLLEKYTKQFLKFMTTPYFLCNKDASAFWNYCRLCEDLDVFGEKMLYPKVDFWTDYYNKKLIGEKRRDEAFALKLLKNTDLNLAFEDENYEVIVPTKVIQYKDESEQQRNCVFRIYLQTVTDGRTNIVFIRKKDNIDKSYITCEVNKNYDIIQYLGRCNAKVQNVEDLTFINKYQNYLDTLK